MFGNYTNYYVKNRYSAGNPPRIILVVLAPILSYIVIR